MEIINPKVRSTDPSWERFPGFSLLFDNPGESLRRTEDGFRLHCDFQSNTALSLYRELAKGAKELLPSDPETSGICPLPPESYHVTYFDGGNLGNAAGANPDIQKVLFELLETLPKNCTTQHQIVLPAVEHAGGLGKNLDLGFRFSHLKNFGNEVLVAVLEPSDENSRVKLELLKEQRAGLSELYRTSFGFGSSPKFTPHVSLAYFANPEIGAGFSEQIDGLDAIFRERLCCLEVRFNSVSAYAFSDMASFYRLSPAD